MKTTFLTGLFCFSLWVLVSAFSISQDAASRSPIADCVEQWQVLKEEVRAKIQPLRRPEFSIQALARGQDKGSMEVVSHRQLPPKLILVIGGLQNDCESSMRFAQALDESLRFPSDTRLAVYCYPNDGSIQESGDVLKRLLQALQVSSPSTRISMVTHSMGGLVARFALEGKCGAAEIPICKKVDQLLMICPPNHGSVLAQYADALELSEAMTRMQKGDESIMSTVQRLIDDGLGEACDELVPGSDFLCKLNDCERATGVKYSIYAGTRGPMSPLVRMVASSTLGEGRSRLRSNEARALDEILTRLDELVSCDELTTGLGDGAVSVRSARLEGVNDFVRIPMHHMDWTDQSKQHVRELVGRIASKLASTSR